MVRGLIHSESTPLLYQQEITEEDDSLTAETSEEDETADACAPEGSCQCCRGCCRRTFPTGYLPELKKTANLSWGLAFIQVCQLGMQPVAVMFGGRLGKLELDTIALSNSLINILGNSVVTGMSTACDTIFSQTFGTKNKKLVGIQLQRALVITLLALCLCYTIHINMEGLLRLMGQNHEVARMTQRYLTVFIPGMLFLFVYVTIRKYVQCQNIVIPHTIIGGVGLGSQILFQYLFVTYLEWGLDGSALAQVSGYFIMMVLSILYIVISKMYIPTWDGMSLRLFLRWGDFSWLALYGMLMTCLEWWAFEITVILSGVLGTTELGAQTIVFNIDAILFAIPSGIAIATSIRIGQELGAGHALKAFNVSRVAYTLTAATNVILAILLLAFSSEIARLFTNIQEVIDIAESIIPILAYYTIIDAVCSVSRGIMRGCGLQGLATLIIFIGYYLIALPIGICLMFLTDLRTMGVWIGLAVGLTVCGTIYFIHTNFVGDWKHYSVDAQIRAEIRKKFAETLPSQQDEQRETSLDTATEKTPLLAKVPVQPEPTTSTSTWTKARKLERHISKVTTPDLVKLGEEAAAAADDQEVTRTLLIKRALTILGILGILLIGILCRLFIVLPIDPAEPVCISLGNGTTISTPFNTTLPFCNTTAFVNISDSQFIQKISLA